MFFYTGVSVSVIYCSYTVMQLLLYTKSENDDLHCHAVSQSYSSSAVSTLDILYMYVEVHTLVTHEPSLSQKKWREISLDASLTIPLARTVFTHVHLFVSPTQLRKWRE